MNDLKKTTYEFYELEKRKAQTYKTLAGSIAHDLHNPLYQIMLLLPKLKQNNNSEVVENISQIINDTFIRQPYRLYPYIPRITKNKRNH